MSVKMTCDRCERDQTVEQLEGINVGDQGINLCHRCADTFFRRFQAFMVGH